MNHITSRNVAPLYNPDLLTKAQLIDNFVVRIKKYEKLISDIRSATMEKPEQPIMLVGLRGMGKTTLLRRLAYEVENDPQLSPWLIPVIFNEEEYGITQLFKLWESIAEYLAKHDKAYEGLYERMDETYRRSKGDQNRYELEAFDILLEALHGQQKKIILFIDNFGDMFRRFKKHEKQRLREILMTCSDLRIIAASAVVIEAFFRHDDPLFEFFKTERLEGLNSEETIALLYKLGEGLPGNPIDYIVRCQPQRVEALRRLTGGIPRSIVLFFEIFVSDRDGTAFSDLESILDRVTPLYKHRMDDLPSQQQEIMQVLALNYDGITTREIADKTRLGSKLVSAQLKQMQRDNLVSVANPGAKNQVYHVYDRFFNIWFLMRMARKSDKSRVLWLVRFMECWCTPEDLTKRGDSHRRMLSKQGGYNPKSALMLSTALFYADHEDIESRYQMTRQTRHYLRDQSPDLSEQTDKSDIALFGNAIDYLRRRDWEAAYSDLLAVQEKNAQDYLLLYVLAHQKGDFEQANEYSEKAQELLKSQPTAARIIGTIYDVYIKDKGEAERYWRQASDLGDAKSMQLLGRLMTNKYRDFDAAKILFEKAIESGRADALMDLGNLHCDKLKDYAQAEICYNIAAAAGHAKGWRLLGIMYADDPKDFKKAEAFYRKAIEAGETDALINLGDLYKTSLKDYAQAEICYQKAAEEGHAVGWHFLGIMYADDLKEYEKAEAFYRKAIEVGEAYALILLGDLYQNDLKDYAQAEFYYQKAAEEGHAEGWHFLGILYADDLKEHEKAGTFYKKAIEAGETDALINLGDLYKTSLKDYAQAEICYQKAAEEGHAEGWQSLGIMYSVDFNDYEKAEAFYQKAIDAGLEGSCNNLAWFYFEHKMKPAIALKTAQQAYALTPQNYVAHTLACIQLWNDQYELAHATAEAFLYERDYLEANVDNADFMQYFLLLLAKEQHAFLYDYFTSERGLAVQSKERFLMIWYALVSSMKAEHPVEYLRIPPELQPTVAEILEKAAQLRDA